MPVDKAVKRYIFVDDGLGYAEMQEQLDGDWVTYDDYEAGQKSLSPEVREIIEQLLDMIKRCEAGHFVRYTADMVIRDKAKMLAKE